MAAGTSDAVILTLAIAALTLLAVLVKPRGLDEGVAALVGGVAMIVSGAVSPGDALHVLASNWNVFLFFLGMLTTTALAEQAGVFAWLAGWAARRSNGSKRRLFLNIFALGVVVSTFLTNDATALILTPVVFTVVTALDLDPLPYMFACTFIADTASLTLPVSNPINLLFAEHLGLGVGDFLRYLLLPSTAAIAVNIGIFLLLFRTSISGHFDTKPGGDSIGNGPESSHPRYFRFSAAVLVLLAVAFVGGGLVGIPAGLVAVVAGMVMVVGASILRAVDARRFMHDFSWSIFPFIAGFFVVVRGVEHAGLTAPLSALLHGGDGSPLSAALVGTTVSAIGTNVINNVPMALATLTTLTTPHLAAGRALVYGAVLGADLGPNITTTGSLSTMLWLLLLRQRGLNIAPMSYLRLGLIVTPPMLLIGALLIGVTV